MSNEALIDTDAGVVRLTRAQLAAVANAHAGRRPDAHALRQAEAAGAITLDGPHPALRPVLATIASARSRGVLRRWSGRRLPAAEILVGDGGVVVLPGGGHPDDIHDLRWHPRPTALARILHDLLDLPAGDGPSPLDATTLPWSELVERAHDPFSGTHLADLRWASPATHEPASVLVLTWHRLGGIAQVVPSENGLVRFEPVHPLDVWTGLTALL